MEKVVIIGSGPAAHTAAIYAARAKLDPLMFEGEMAGGIAAGGQLTTTTEVENYPGFIQITGPDLMFKMREQALRCGARIETKTIEWVNFLRHPFQIGFEDKTIESQAIIIATGATAKRLAIPGEGQFWQKGISACAVCDGALPIYRNKSLVVVGGGDTAVEEATYLSKFGSVVNLLVRRGVMRASKVMQERVFSNPKINVFWNTIPVEAIGNTLLTHVKTRHVESGEENMVEAGGLFYAIGHQPNTAFLDGQLMLDEAGYIVTQPGTTGTSISGVFACGDVQDKIYRQAVTAAGSGCMAALDTERYLGEAFSH